MKILDYILHWFQENLAISKENILEAVTYSSDSPLLFNSGLFLCLFLLFYCFYYFTVNFRLLRLSYIVLFSIFFYYKSSGVYFLLLILCSIIDFNLGHLLHKETRENWRKFYVTLNIVISLSFLAYFKYTNFIIGTYNNLFNGSFAFFDIILPVGISFYTFQSLSYSIDLYRKQIEPTKLYIEYLFFLSFFPHLVAGPVVRAKDFLHQIYQPITLTKEVVNRAFFLIIGGLIKKAIISDYISINFVDRVFDAPMSYTPFENLMASYGYAIQIYCDFSGYSDMAIGIALLLGYQLPINFKTPYQSSSITEFWRRWHISLSNWLRDFLYFSVGGNRKGTFWGIFFPSVFFFSLIVWGIVQVGDSYLPLFIALVSCILFMLTFILSKDKERSFFTNVNLMTTMLLGGLWHGASLRFIIWGALHGLALSIDKLFMEWFPRTEDKSKKWYFFKKGIGILLTFHFVVFCWLFFRAKDFETALIILQNISNLNFNLTQWQVIASGYAVVFALLAIAYLWHFIPQQWMFSWEKTFGKLPIFFKALLLGFVYWLVYATASAGPQPFIYFQF